MARFGHAASVVALMVALSATADGQAQSVQTGYTYDVHGRLTKVTRPSTATEYEYDKAQNRTRVKIYQANAIPVANPDEMTVVPGFAQSINPLINDTDADSDAFFLTEVRDWNPSKGNVTFVANCLSTATSCVTYTAASGATGQDSFIYKISDGKNGTAEGTVTVNFSATPPVPTAQNFAVTITPNSAGNVSGYSLPLSFTGGTPTSVSLHSPPTNGSATPSQTSLLYSSTGWSGTATLQYKGTNSAGTGPAATGTINVKPVVNAVAGSATPNQQRTLALAPKTNYTSLVLDALPTKGQANIIGSTVYYTANSNATGADTFSYKATSPVGDSAPASITFNISCAAPTVGTTSATVAYNSQSNVIPLNISGTGITSVNYVTGTSHGSVEPIGATMYYSPFQGYSGSDSFTYTATNACGTSNVGTANITVQGPPNHNPVIVVGTTDHIGQSTSVTIQPQADDTDPDGDLPLTVTSVSNLRFANGSINGSGSAPASIGSVTNYGTYVVYNAPFLSNTPPSGSSYMAVVFDYTVSDGRGGTATGAHVVNVYNYFTNNAPVAQNDSSTVATNESIFVPVINNDSDQDGDPLSIVSLSTNETTRAYYSVAASGIEVSPKGPTGSDTISYTISDGRGGTATATLTMRFLRPF